MMMILRTLLWFTAVAASVTTARADEIPTGIKEGEAYALQKVPAEEQDRRLATWSNLWCKCAMFSPNALRSTSLVSNVRTFLSLSHSLDVQFRLGHVTLTMILASVAARRRGLAAAPTVTTPTLVYCGTRSASFANGRKAKRVRSEVVVEVEERAQMEAEVEAREGVAVEVEERAQMEAEVERPVARAAVEVVEARK
jgi:hypothetical protein